ncbi:sigma-70 family RNA polymerase sigma factor [Aestuariibius sp. 2305UL40-4]|uniref:sigma-70 family RNA polymerase sigma factor n=1 Tax=Aestuariibius violaceus TaxID=3234132 RepID=UPI00345EE522
MNKPVTNLIHGARRVRSSGMLSAEKERALICAWQAYGDRRARDYLIHAFAPLAASVAKRLKLGAGEADPDLMQQAQIGLMKAADRFDPDRGFRFSTYAVWWARAEVQDFMRANTSAVRRPNSALTRAAAAQIAAIDAEVAADPGMDQAVADMKLADALGVDLQQAASLREQVTGVDISLNAHVQGSDGMDRMALLADPSSIDGPAALRKLETAGLRKVLAAALNTLPDRERDIIIATQVTDPPATLQDLGTRYGISRERVRQLRERGFERLRAALRQRDLGLESFL